MLCTIAIAFSTLPINYPTRLFTLYEHISIELVNLEGFFTCSTEELTLHRESLTRLILQQQDDEYMRVMANIFGSQRTGWIPHIYWDDLESSERVWKSSGECKDVEPSCSVM
jgi:hypothetical protein